MFQFQFHGGGGGGGAAPPPAIGFDILYHIVL